MPEEGLISPTEHEDVKRSGGCVWQYATWSYKNNEDHPRSELIGLGTKVSCSSRLGD